MDIYERSFNPEVDAEQEWEAKWEEFIRLARQYGWPEDYLQAYLQTHRVSYQERLESLDWQRLKWKEFKHRPTGSDWVKLYAEIAFENKRTMMRIPANPDGGESKGLR